MPAVRVLVPSIPSGIAGLGIAGDTQDPSGVDTLAEELTRNVRNDTKEKLFKEGKEEEEEEISLIFPTADFVLILFRGVSDQRNVKIDFSFISTTRSVRSKRSNGM